MWLDLDADGILGIPSRRVFATQTYRTHTAAFLREPVPSYPVKSLAPLYLIIKKIFGPRSALESSARPA